ncbi:ABC transporter ATP-binding protein [Clostridiaceae bacterium HSG29]|nr:ABC transporter ATP-binding protein [Clostridiaceae bacterium HSG29]
MENKRYNKKIIKRLTKSLLEYKKNVIMIIILMISTAGIEALIPYLNKYAIDEFIVNNNFENFNLFILIYIITVILLSFLVYAFIACAGKLETNFVYDLRKKAFEKLQMLSLSYYDKNAEGWIISRLTSDIGNIGEKVTWGIVDMIWGTAMMSFILIVMFVINIKLTLVIVALMPVIMLVSYYFQNKLLVAYRKIRKLNSLVTGRIAESISGIVATKVLVSEKQNYVEFEKITENMRASTVKAAVSSAVYLSVVIIISSIGTAMAIYYGGSGVIMNTVSYGTFVMFLTYTRHFFEPIKEIARVLAEFKTAQASIERVYGLIDEEIDIVDSKDVTEKYGDMINKKIENWDEVKGKVQFKNLDFHYNEKEPIFSNFNLTVKPGTKIAIVGETGSGKSTLINIVSRFYEPINGTVYIDDVDYKERSISWLHSNIGYVLQDPHLFSGTIRENIRYGNLNADDEKIIEVSKLVNAHEFIMKKDGQYDYEVGENGELLSTGEKQLISFARAIISNPKIFVLDEATSSIDTETEYMIQKAIDNITRNRTSFIVAHRLSTIVNADRILVMKKGEIIEAGTHEELLMEKGHYYSLYEIS